MGHADGSLAGAAPVTRAKTALRAAAIVAAASGLALVIHQVNRPANAREALIDGKYAAAEAMLLAQAEAGDAEAMNLLGNLHYLGYARKRDKAAAAKLYLKAALAGNTDAQINIAHLYSRGEGVPKDPLRSFGWMRQARQAGSGAAENHIKWLSSRVQLSTSQMMYVRELYPTVESLDPERAK